MQPTYQPPMNGQHAPQPKASGAPPPPLQQAPPPQQYYQAPPQYYQQGPPPAMWGHPQQHMPPQYAPPPQQVTSVKIIRNKHTGQPEGYGFIEFQSRAAAEYALGTFNGQMMPNVEQVFKLNWASCSAGDKRGDDGSDHTIFVGDLAADVTDAMLEEIFKATYPSVKGANVVTDRATGRSKGYGFVRFGDLNEQTRAMTEMNGVLLSTRQMRIGPAANKKNMGTQQTYSTNGYQSSQVNEAANDPNNTTIFVGGLDSNIDENYLRQVFTPYGEVGYVKIPVGKRCGFVQFTSRACAEQAISALNGSQIGSSNVRLSWGRSQNKQAPQQDANQGNGNSYYGYQQGPDAYYGAPNVQDPSMQNYGYSGYGSYEQQQQPSQQQQPPQQQPPQQQQQQPPQQ
ncbi:unnamed protein product [Triticum turgidum subsp. durum]|uniref:RRM domain-containing protein n=1 Tax=Triticum turgidum subsp. durum TaxID=4567 RepID=A0A9R1PL43_TRITD|nr:unnamed protein product [Triticum turgidum subsp. durum]